jgi:hypothetical protein
MSTTVPAPFDPAGPDLFAELQAFGAPVALRTVFLLRAPAGDEQESFPVPPAPWNGTFVTARVPIAPGHANRWQVLASVVVVPGEGVGTRLKLVLYQGGDRIGETPTVDAPVSAGDEYASAELGPVILRRVSP